jgi:hypothetical protein
MHLKRGDSSVPLNWKDAISRYVYDSPIVLGSHQWQGVLLKVNPDREKSKKSVDWNDPSSAKLERLMKCWM